MLSRFSVALFVLSFGTALPLIPANAEPPEVSGIYPHLAMFNDEGECGTGAVVPWADRLWVITYGPHLPFGSSDKLYEITPDLMQIIRPESVGGTPANRMIHKETQQLLIGPYVIDAQGLVRVLTPDVMPGRLTGNARHLTEPARKAYYATMEEALYEVDLETLEVVNLIRDGNRIPPDFTTQTKLTKLESKLPGYHGKGLYSGQGRVVYANNGDRDPRVVLDPSTPSGALGEWKKAGEDWKLVRRNQFTEVTGPGGIEGNSNPEKDPIWSIGWDHQSLILMCLSQGKWHSYRLPKSSHSYDGAHGWNTEWPRIRDIGEKDLLMTMHGAFWRFPKDFSPSQSAGLKPRSNYLKVIGDFCLWKDRIVMGCDDSANKEFLNKRKAKGQLAGPGQSQSNLWFVRPDQLDSLGPVIGRGSVWLSQKVKKDEVSEPYLFSGYEHRSITLTWQAKGPTGFEIEKDELGDGKWKTWKKLENLPAKGEQTIDVPQAETGAWVRIKSLADSEQATALFHYRNADTRASSSDALFQGLSQADDTESWGGLMLARGKGLQTLRVAKVAADGSTLGCYDLNAELKLSSVNDEAGVAWTAKNAAIPQNILRHEASCIVYEDEKGTWLLPKAQASLDKSGPLGQGRVCREVCTERDLFHAGGTFFELPAENADGFAKVRPISTHNFRIHDYASYRGLLVLSGLSPQAEAGEHILRADDGKMALWVGAVDDLWKLGKPRGEGGPWKNTAVEAGKPSAPYLFTGYDKKSLSLQADKATEITLEADLTGTGTWVKYQSFSLQPGVELKHEFPASFGAYWLRFTSRDAAVLTAYLRYE